MKIPRMYKVFQSYPQPAVGNIEEEVENELEKINIRKMVNEGDQVAITAGSRGITNIDKILATVIQFFKGLGARPFIVPAMGSHGGATAEGQEEVLKNLGIYEENIGAPVVSSMEVVQLGTAENGAAVYMDKNAARADAVFVVNRIKPHTKFKAEIESGLLKMIAVGLGKRAGCTEMHAHGLDPVIRHAARVAMEKAPVIAGLGIVENAAKQTAKIKAVKKEDMEKVEVKLLAEAKELMPSLPVEHLDLLIIQEIGKNISGSGMDVNVIGRVTSACPGKETPHIEWIVALDFLQEVSHGNALGMGLADVITKRFLDKVDLEATYANVIIAGSLEKGKIPVTRDSDKDAVEVALDSLQKNDIENARVMFIKNTMELTKLLVSESLISELKDKSNIEIAGGVSLEFDMHNNLMTEGWW